MASVGDDCYYFYYASCIKGPACPFRHVEEARANEVTCNDWRFGRCGKPLCPFRHMEIQQKNRQSIPCYFETQPGGCTKPNCGFMHQYRKNGGPAGPPPTSIGVVSQNQLAGPPPGWNPVTRTVGPVILPQQSHPPWPAPGMRGPGFMPPQAKLPPPPQGVPPQPFRPFQEVPAFKQQVDPVVINLNSEESDQDSLKGGSPTKAPSRTIIPLGGGAPGILPQGMGQPPPQVKSDNPLDYFLNAKPWVDPRIVKRPSPARSPSPSRKREGSLSPQRRSRSPDNRSRSPDRRSHSPGPGRRRSVSVERYDRPMDRRRSGSLDRSRSQSPDWRDRRRVRRSRSPEPRRRSPMRDRFYRPDHVRDRPRNLVNRFRIDNKGPKLEEVKLAGPKVISTKKEKKEEEGNKVEVSQEKEQPAKQADPSKSSFVEEEVKSLEDIYRERALMSMMEAKKKRIMEQKRKRWEAVKTNKQSESEKSDADKESGEKDQDNSQETRDGESEKVNVDNAEDEDNGKTESSSSGSDNDNEEEEAEADLADDVDVEIDAGDIDIDAEADKDEQEAESDKDSSKEKTETRKQSKAWKKGNVTKIASQATKPSIKSRLGLKAVEQVEQQALKDRLGSNVARARSVKDRLGLRPTSENADKPARSGIIKLNRLGQRGDSSPSRSQSHHDSRAERPRTAKDVLLLPQITIRNRQTLEEKKTGIRKRLGLLDSDEDSDHKKKRSPMDEELWHLLQEEEIDIEESELDLLSKKERRKLLKKLLARQGREDEYEDLKRMKRRRGFRKKKERDIGDEVKDRKRKINIRSRLGPSPDRVQSSDDIEEEEGEDLELGDEIELGVEDQQEEGEGYSASDQQKDSATEEEKDDADIESQKESVEEKQPVEPVTEQSRAEMRKQKEARLKEALEPKSLADIRRERALKRARTADDIQDSEKPSLKGRRVNLGREKSPEQEKPEPVVRVTFRGQEPTFKRKLIRLGDTVEQNENNQPSSTKMVKPLKRERQIYMPPASKRDGTATVMKATEAAKKPKIDREILDYSDPFPRSASTGNLRKLNVVKAPESASDTTEVRPPLKLQRGPMKVEVKDATVKTFAEIMAEKKRKRLLAQQANSPEKKPYKPIVFDDVTDSSPAAAATESDPTPDVKSRLSPVMAVSSVDDKFSSVSQTISSNQSSSFVKSAPAVSGDTNSDQTVKPARWKRRKSNPNLSTAKSTAVSPVLSGTNVQEDVAAVGDSGDSGMSSVKTDSVLKVSDKGAASSGVGPKHGAVIETAEEKISGVSPAKKQKSMDASLLDFDDFDLDLDDGDTNANMNTKDHDELLREIDELLA